MKRIEGLAGLAWELVLGRGGMLRLLRDADAEVADGGGLEFVWSVERVERVNGIVACVYSGAMRGG